MVESRRDGGFRVVWLILFTALAAVGATLLATSFRRPAPAPPPAPASASQADRIPGLAEYKANLQPLPAGEGRAAAAQFNAAQKSRFVSSSARLEIALVRTLDRGQELESQLVLLYRDSQPDDLLQMEVRPRMGTPTTYLARVHDGGVTQVQLAAAGHPVRTLDLEEGVPLALGDLPLEDGISFFSMNEADLNPVGRLDDLGSRHLVVFEQTTGKPRPKPALDAPRTSLVYVEPDEAALRAIRVFDGDGRLLRVYEDFQFDTSGPVWRLRSFRVASPSRGSHTLYRMTRWDLGAAVAIPNHLPAPPAAPAAGPPGP